MLCLQQSTPQVVRGIGIAKVWAREIGIFPFKKSLFGAKKFQAHALWYIFNICFVKNIYFTVFKVFLWITSLETSFKKPTGKELDLIIIWQMRKLTWEFGQSAKVTANEWKKRNSVEIWFLGPDAMSSSSLWFSLTTEQDGDSEPRLPCPWFRKRDDSGLGWLR